ncbi:MAG: Pentatricopeptide repeat-containing, partial [Trebouxia sp. A1-2]
AFEGIANSPAAKRQKTGETEAANGHTPCSAAKTRDPAAGITAYNRAVAEGISVDLSLYSVLLYLCSGGDEWECPLHQQLVEKTPLVESIMQQAAADVAEAQAATAVAEDVAVLSSDTSTPAATNGEQGSTPTAADLPADSPGTPDATDGANTTAVDADNTAAGCGLEGTKTQVAVAVVVKMSPAELHQAGRSIFDQMQKSSTKPLELAYTALARMAATAGDGDAALEATIRGLTAGVTPKLRGFVPALLAYAVAGEPEKAFQVADLIQEQKLDLTESEFALLLQACARGAASWQSVKALLSRMTKELTRLQPETLAAAEQYFRSDAALAAVEGRGKGKGRGCWVLEPCTVSDTGQTSNCGGQLQALDLEEEEWDQFANGIAQLAAQRERKPKDFKVFQAGLDCSMFIFNINVIACFQAWLEQHGPVEALIDGANVALYGQNWERGAFSFGQIKGVMDQLGRTHPDLHPLMMLHVGRTKGPAAECKPGKTLLADLKKRHAFYATPTGSNDDWYWMYAAVKAGPKGLLISNDEMRDHMFQLLAPRFFHKWKQRHQASACGKVEVVLKCLNCLHLLQVKFTFDESGLHLHHPAAYTVCAQGLANGSYVFPAARGNAWLSARLHLTD